MIGTNTFVQEYLPIEYLESKIVPVVSILAVFSPAQSIRENAKFILDYKLAPRLGFPCFLFDACESYLLNFVLEHIDEKAKIKNADVHKVSRRFLLFERVSVCRLDCWTQVSCKFFSNN